MPRSKSASPQEMPATEEQAAVLPTQTGLPRRDFVAISGITLATLFQSGPVMAGPFQTSDFEKLIPRDKKLRPEWVASLTTRGASTVYRKSRGELRFIGMPIGGICSGGLYLGGDGKLWLWDIFNANQNGILPRNVRWAGFNGEQTVDPQNGATLVCSRFDNTPLARPAAARPDLPVVDFDQPTYGAWKVEGDAFGAGPILRSAIPGYQGDVGGKGQRVVNSHASAPGNDVNARRLEYPASSRYFLSLYRGKIGGRRSIK
ncbi:MAG: hypothetical protein JWL77_3675 [Chthonomonadaceae bacterium]|nr:hypothetical protein [Chthonomonadaceae bacterium]